MTLSKSDLYKTYERTNEYLQKYRLLNLEEKFKTVKKQFEDKKQNIKNKILVYGVYNAGKSSLINALLGEEKALVQDVPTTYSIDAYQWKNFTLFDTPGVDAPEEHEKKTNAEMEKADSVIFVIDPVGAADEQETIEVIIDLVAKQKQVFLVLNDKSELKKEDMERKKDQLRKKLQEIAGKQDLKNVLCDIPIYEINAKSALKAKLNNQEEFINKTGILNLEKDLESFLSSVTEEAITLRLATELNSFISSAISDLERSANTDILKKFNEALRNLTEQYQQAKSRIIASIQQNRRNICQEVKSALLSNPQGSEQRIHDIYQHNTVLVHKDIDDEVNTLSNKYTYEITELRQFSTDNLVTEKIAFDKEHNTPHVDMGELNALHEAMTSVEKPSQNDSGFDDVIAHIPTIITTFATKIPYLNIIAPLIGSLLKIFNSDDGTQQLREQERRRERFQAQVHDLANDLSRDFENKIMNLINKKLEPWFDQLIVKVKNTIGGLSQQQQQERDLLTEFGNIKGLLSTFLSTVHNA